MNRFFLISTILIIVSSGYRPAVAQSAAHSDKAIFYNFTVKKCHQAACKAPYSIELNSVKSITGSFKGINERETPSYEINQFLITVYDKRSGQKRWETVIPNPVEVNVEYDGNSQDHLVESGSSLQRKVIDLESGAMTLRLPFSPSECNIEIGFISSPDRIIPIATF